MPRRMAEAAKNILSRVDFPQVIPHKNAAPLLRRFLTELRKKQHAAGRAAPLNHETAGGMVAVPVELLPTPQFTHRLSPTRASWLCVSKPEKLDEKQRHQVEHMRQ
jgi:hypothetical protein